MNTDPRAALDRFLAALEVHFDAIRQAEGDSDAVVDAEAVLEDAFFTYDDALASRYGVALPFDLFDEDFDEEDLDEDDELADEDEFEFEDRESDLQDS
ncbi:hypothetical protein [Buchananella hordeovulneris]|uniref:DNA primase n=1 Tax=Buchananella hordeovulneris TaxID=52770 RepID=A0A1Q5PXP8_9ACTO|nr:hypothetical protein [Buchananella hordeovulneris]MDO5080782.1 DNA primase [Buchananella hordeovulneris]OKL52307.1 hypothetical protein BSZ40_02135 [Buchananella hordeovulneris]